MMGVRIFLLCVLELNVANAVLAAGLFAFGALGPPANDSLLTPARRKEGVVRTIDRIYHGGGKVGYLVYMDGRRFQLDMERDESVLSHHFNPKYVIALMGDGEASAPLHRECVYRGTVDSNPESLAVFSLCGGSLEGFFAVKHARYTITPLIRAKGHENDVRVMEDKDADSALHLFTKESFSFEAMPVHESCGTQEGREHRDATGKRRRKGRGNGKRDRSGPAMVGEAHNLAHGRKWTRFAKPATPNLGNRRKRSVSRSRHVELLLVADEFMAKKYGKDLHHYFLTSASIATNMFGHASLVNPIRSHLVNYVIDT